MVAIKRRNRIDISADILETAKNGANKTQIVYNTNLNFSIAKKYLEMLEENELIRQEGSLFITTEKGKTFHDLAMLLKL